MICSVQSVLKPATWLCCALPFLSSVAFAQDQSTPSTAYEQCILNAFSEQFSEKASLYSIENVKKYCATQLNETTKKAGAVDVRINHERETAFNPFVITPHRMNYILPYTYTDQVNPYAYNDIGWAEHLKNGEAKFQISLKVPLNTGDLLFDNDRLFFGFTIKSYWQVYANELSRPFRETNYRPEMFYITPSTWTPLGGKTWFGFGLEHESNGRSQLLSRSWNRLYANFVFAKDDLVVALQPWYRLPEDEKKHPLDPDGDDNPDIEDYMGHFELTTVYKWEHLEFNFMGRQNFRTHKGFAELGMTFPLWGRLRGYVQYTTGYGDSMIDYNINQNRIGVGVALTDLL